MTPPPAWFSAALDAAVRDGTTTVDGASIAYRAWGDPDGRSIVLVHGGAAHSRWWDHIAPLLTNGSASPGGGDPPGLEGGRRGPVRAR
jgi:pimeloyl-ACP methyl ester carboxylesterase